LVEVYRDKLREQLAVTSGGLPEVKCMMFTMACRSARYHRASTSVVALLYSCWCFLRHRRNRKQCRLSLRSRTFLSFSKKPTPLSIIYTGRLCQIGSICVLEPER
jgi:hypothetical protein